MEDGRRIEGVKGERGNRRKELREKRGKRNEEKERGNGRKRRSKRGKMELELVKAREEMKIKAVDVFVLIIRYTSKTI